MSDTPNLDELRNLNNRLTALLNDAETGMMSWHMALAEVLIGIRKFSPKS